MELFADLMHPTQQTRILDVGGTPWFWDEFPRQLDITFLNLCIDWPPNGFRVIAGDARKMPFTGNSFDIVFSNSVIEHLGTWERQQQMASEMRRVAAHYFVQTPNFWFPFEPHYLAPFVQYLPPSVRRETIRWFTPFGWITKPSREKVMELVEEIALLSASKLSKLFPDAQICRETVLGVTKSLIAYK